MKTKFKIKLDTEFEVDFNDWDFTDNERSKEEYFKKAILDEYFDEIGFDEFKINEVKETSLFEVMGEMFKPK
jgi:hypothetical protein